MLVAFLRALLLRQLERLASQRQSRPVTVDRIELNHYWWAAGCENHQVILWQWSPDEGQFKAQRFFFLDGDLSEVPRRLGNGNWRFTYYDKVRGNRVLVFETSDFIETVTAHDPWHRARAA